MPGLSPQRTKSKLIKTSYKDFLVQDVKVHGDVVKIFQTSTHDIYGVGIDAVSAYDCAREGYPGFKGMNPPQEPREKRRTG